MKKTIILIFMALASCNVLTAQLLFDIKRSIAANLYLDKDKSKEIIEGSPYSNVEFNSAKISGTEEKGKLRYNSHDDVFEMQSKDNKIYNVNKNEPYSTIIFENNIGTYRLVTYTNDKTEYYGYLLSIYTNKFEVLKREKIYFVEAQAAKSSYDSNKPAKFVKASVEYYWNLTENKFVFFPTSKKKLIDLFPTKKNEINQFFKDFSPNFKDEKSIALIADFCSKL